MKNIPFTCPHCGTFTEVAADYAGQTGPCAACRKPVTVPEVATVQSVRPTKVKKFSQVIGFLLTSLLLAAVFVTIFGLVFVAAFQPESIPFIGKVAPPPPACKANLERIGAAIDAYVKAKGHYPPAYIADKQGKPMHSWRVLILPFLGENKLHSEYNFDQPWNSTDNLRVSKRMPDVFNCPNQSAVPDETSYMVICGPTLVFDGTTERKPEEITDRMEDTLLVVEVVGTDVHWTEPVDLSVSNMDWSIGKGDGIGSMHGIEGAHALMADGVVRHLDTYFGPEEMQGMATRGGGEKIDPSVFESLDGVEQR